LLVRALPTGTVTFLFSDIEGSTRLLHELGPERYAEALAEHRRVMREAFGAAGGVEVDTQGDAFFVAFPEAAGALAAAARAQERLARGPVRVRMGIHSGEPLLTDEGYVGMDVHRGARVMSAGHGGQVLVSQATRALVPGDELVELGLHRLKDLTEPQPLYQLGAGEFPPLKTLYQSNLPVQPTPLIGRDAELAEVLGLLRQSRLVTLTGAGGSGKTRLALQAAAHLAEEFRHGVWWVGLAAVHDSDLVEQAIAQVLGAKDPLPEFLAGRSTLLLLDNFEQLLDAAPQIGTLLAGAPDLCVLTTSRERLGIAAEQEYAVPTMGAVEAVALFTARARQLNPGFEPDEAVAELCRRLDDLPLAIELAAARAKVLPPKAILARLDRRLEVLGVGPRDAPERQRTIRGTIQWSYDLLDEEERRLFRRLAIFVGGFSLEAAEAICEATVDGVQSLFDKSLVRQSNDERFFLLETIREYAAEQLTASDEEDELIRRYELFFVELAERAEPGLLSGAELRTISALELDSANLRAVEAHAIARGHPDSALRILGPLWRFYEARGHVGATRSLIGFALELPPGDQAVRAKGLFASARLAFLAGEYAEARPLLEEALRLYEQLGDRAGAASCLAGLGWVEGWIGEPEEAVRLCERAVALARTANEPWVLADALNNLGCAFSDAGARSDARRAHEEALELRERIGSGSGIASSCGNLGELARVDGAYDEAAELLARSAGIAAEHGEWWLQAANLVIAAEIAAEQGDQRLVAQRSAEAQALCDQFGYPSLAARVSALASRQRREQPVARDALD
jgi:predicted ATPase